MPGFAQAESQICVIQLLPRVLDKRKDVIVLSSSGENLELWVTNLDRKNPGGIIAIQGNRKYVNKEKIIRSGERHEC